MISPSRSAGFHQRGVPQTVCRACTDLRIVTSSVTSAMLVRRPLHWSVRHETKMRALQTAKTVRSEALASDHCSTTRTTLSGFGVLMQGASSQIHPILLQNARAHPARNLPLLPQKANMLFWRGELAGAASSTLAAIHHHLPLTCWKICNPSQHRKYCIIRMVCINCTSDSRRSSFLLDVIFRVHQSSIGVLYEASPHSVFRRPCAMDAL